MERSGGLVVIDRVRLLTFRRRYENEEDCGRAINDFIKKSGVPREEIWFTTKLSELSPHIADLGRALADPVRSQCTTRRSLRESSMPSRSA